jgi:DNA mismatch repair protein MutL
MSDVIRLLPDHVANQIAAGEVVQRPASAVKELLENSVDAGATHITLIVKDGGRTLIQVVDDGAGMSSTDARLCFERHATSKIREADDLLTLSTNGFRGEALASIAAIAHVNLKSRREADELGTDIDIEGSRITKQEACATPVGTSVSVRNLFYNVPARRQFLKSDGVEMKHIIEEFQRVALAHPEIGFDMINNDQEAHKLPISNPRKRIVHLLGKKYDERLVPVEEATDLVSVVGFVGKPEFARKTRGEQFFFVNQRFIKSNYLNHAIHRAYEELISRDQYPSWVLFLSVDPATIDINIHPTKTEIKFRDERNIYAIVNAAVRRALGRFNISPTLDFDQEASLQFGGDAPMIAQQVSSKVVGNWRPQDIPRSTNTAGWQQMFDVNPATDLLEKATREDRTPEPKRGELQFDQEKPAQHKAFQLHGKYVLAQLRNGFVVIDRQRAHERILYERTLRNLDSGAGSSQQMLFPQNIELNPADMELIQAVSGELNGLGFMFTPMGGNTIAVNGMPSEASEVDPEQLLEDLIEQIKAESGTLKNERHEGMARVIAQSIRINTSKRLDVQEMHDLIDQLFACEMPFYTASGKPTLLTWGLDELEERFGER